MKKGQRVRILKTGDLGTIADKELIRQAGKVRKYYQVKLDKSPTVDRWFFDDQFGPVVETCRLKFEGKGCGVLIEHDHERHTFAVTYNPNQDPIRRDSLEAFVVNLLVDGLNRISIPKCDPEILPNGIIYLKKL